MPADLSQKRKIFHLLVKEREGFCPKSITPAERVKTYSSQHFTVTVVSFGLPWGVGN
jgi:hypothetical protein